MLEERCATSQTGRQPEPTNSRRCPSTSTLDPLSRRLLRCAARVLSPVFRSTAAQQHRPRHS
eukprot:1329024-Rhodomonas_salina.1